MRSVCKSVVGMLRKNNEDYVFCNNDKFSELFIVADGMGGCNAGEIASYLAVKSFVKFLNDNIDSFNNNDVLLDLLVSSLQKSNSVVYSKSCESDDLCGMGTTLDAVVIRNNKLLGVHIGDSRIYLFRKNKLQRLTEDHSYVMELVKLGKITEKEAENHPNKNIITRAIGTKFEVDIDTVITDVLDDDIILLCTDGLTTMLNDNEIEHVLCFENDISEKLNILIDMANNKGGFDNISIILIELNKEEAKR